MATSWLRITGALALGLALGFAPAVAGGLRVEIVAFGLYARSAELGPMPSGFRVHSIDGVSLMRMPRLVRATTSVPARLCVRFGLQYRAPDLAPNQQAVAEIRVTHPMLTRPDGRQSDEDTYDIPLGRGVAWTGFDFDERWETQPGTWTFSVMYGGEVVASQRFTVVPAAPDPASDKSCGMPVA